MNILAIDIGTQMGWAFTTRAGAVTGGSEGFQPAKCGGHGGKFLAFLTFLNGITAAHGDVHAVYYEDVKMHQGVLAAHAYGGFLAILQVWCKLNNAPLHPLGVGQIKQSWTGKGNANKDRMIEVAKQRGFAPVDNNHADALAILSMACTEEGRPFPDAIGKPVGALV